MSQLQETSKEKGLMMTADAWGERQAFTSNDIVVPKILPLQFMSEKVKNKEGEYGDFRDTLNNDLFGNLETPVEFIPLYVSKKWIEYDVITNKAGAKKREYKQVVPITHANDNLPYVDEDAKIERDRCVEVYVLIPQHIKEGNSFPYVLSFRRTSLKAGNKIITQILRNERMNLAPAAATMLLSGKSVQNDDGEFVVMDVKTGRQSTPEEVRECFQWYKLVASGKTKVDDSDLTSATEKVVTAEQVENSDY